MYKITAKELTNGIFFPWKNDVGDRINYLHCLAYYLLAILQFANNN